MNESFQKYCWEEKKLIRESSAEFVEENLKTIFAYALSRVSDKNDAEDLTNDIVLAILQSSDKIRNYNAFYGYVWGIAANTYRKFMRKKSRFSFDELDDNSFEEFDFTDNRAALEEKIRRTVSGEIEPEFMILTEAEENSLFEILSTEAEMMADLYSQLFSCACRIMKNHVPKELNKQADGIVFRTLFFRTVGLIGGCAVKSKSLDIPDFDGPAAMYIRVKSAVKKDGVV